MPDVHQLFVRLFYGVEVTPKHDDGSTVGRKIYISTHGRSTPRPCLFTPRKRPATPCIGGRVGQGSGLLGCGVD